MNKKAVSIILSVFLVIIWVVSYYSAKNNLLSNYREYLSLIIFWVPIILIMSFVAYATSKKRDKLVPVRHRFSKLEIPLVK